MKRRSSVNSNFEQLEGRVLLAGHPMEVNYSTNWSGYAVVETAKDSVSAVSGAWTVPTVASSRSSGYSADWVGIDGYSSNTVEQLGTEEDTTTAASREGTPQYYAWFEMYPGASWIISDTVKAGDAISASVTFLGSSYTKYAAQGNTRTGMYTGNKTTTTKTLNDNFQLTIADSTEGWTFTIPQSIAYNSDQRNSAEWIVEAPSNGYSTLPLSNFGSVTFTSALATINGTSGSIGSNPAAVLNSEGNPTSSGWTAIDMVNGRNQTIAATSVLNAAGDSFEVAYGSTTPAAPGTDPAPTTTTTSGTSGSSSGDSSGSDWWDQWPWW